MRPAPASRRHSASVGKLTCSEDTPKRSASRTMPPMSTSASSSGASGRTRRRRPVTGVNGTADRSFG